ncbi:helix-turn-helix transcriptional regulator [Marinobacter sp. AC-23]|uniref:helix-turn-helix domain-containing protein n=1 Tax=Marinobacter sp. AC-23 TaxID=1879031 RepID=UPI0008DDC419|nr:helix-turn-helix transcriptional regulator [Marinobacter sp. AC-23]OHY78745.1 hypothetical protein BCA33_17585 [Marinobacter sp. AC-23]
MSKAIERQEAQDTLIFNVTEDILIAMEDAKITKAELARKLNKSKSRISSMLSGDANMTLRTLASICFELEIGVDVRIGDEYSVRDARSNPKWTDKEAFYFEDEVSSQRAPYYSERLNVIDFDFCNAGNDHNYWQNNFEDVAEA